MKKSLANAIAKHLNEVAKNTTDETAFVVNVYGGLSKEDSYIELLPDYKRRTKNAKYAKLRLSAFHHITVLADIERYHKVHTYVVTDKATFEGVEYDVCRATIF